jgi:hypothetical protein
VFPGHPPTIRRTGERPAPLARNRP